MLSKAQKRRLRNMRLQAQPRIPASLPVQQRRRPPARPRRRGKPLTEPGSEWLIQSMDPYHDIEHPIQGYPDANGSRSVVLTYNYTTTVSAPGGAAGNWDAHIFTTPFDYEPSTYEGAIDIDGLYVEGGGGSQGSLGLVTVARADEGEILFPIDNPNASVNFDMDTAADFDVALRPGLSRIVGFGFEVIDTTAVVNRQGSLLAYRAPQHVTRQVWTLEDAPARTFTGPCTVDVAMRPPTTATEASRYRDIVQWSAPEGCYVVVPINGVDNPPTFMERTYTAFMNQPNETVTSTVLMSHLNVLAANAPPALSSFNLQHPKVFRNHALCGVFLSGLALTATFKLRIRVIVEVFPHCLEAELAAQASPSPPLDTAAMELYSVLVSRLPVAVVVGANAHGDWWRAVLRIARIVAPRLGFALGPIFAAAPAIGYAVGQVARSADYLTSVLS